MEPSVLVDLAEWFAYLCFPLFAFVFWRLRDKPVAAVVGAAAFLTVLYFVFEQAAGFPLTEATIRWGALRIVPCFALGCALYLVYRKVGQRLSALLAGGAAAIAFVLMMVSAALGLWDGITVLCAGALILALAVLPMQAPAGWPRARPSIWVRSAIRSIWSACRGICWPSAWRRS